VLLTVFLDSYVKSPHLFTGTISTSEASLVSSNHTRCDEECAERMEALCTVHHLDSKRPPCTQASVRNIVKVDCL
jgi:hypothetical protein